MIDRQPVPIRRPWWGHISVHAVRPSRRTTYVMACPCGWTHAAETTTPAAQHARTCEYASPAQLTFDGWAAAA